MNRDRLMEILGRIGAVLRQPARICLIGSAPAILSGQNSRITNDIDVWRPVSEFDDGDLASACRAAGVLFDPMTALGSNDEYLQIIRPGVIDLPIGFETRLLGVFGNLSVVMPPPVLIAASKLVRAAERDLSDIVWWVNEHRIGVAEIEAAIESLPRADDREDAVGNLMIVRLVAGRKR